MYIQGLHERITEGNPEDAQMFFEKPSGQKLDL